MILSACLASAFIGFVLGSCFVAFARDKRAEVIRKERDHACVVATNWRHAAERAELAQAEAEARLELMSMGRGVG